MPFPVWMIPFSGLNTWLELFREYKKHWKKNIFIPSLQSGVINYISCFDYSIYCCTFQYNKDLLTMVSSGGKLKNDSSAWVLMRVYYQIEIPYPVSHLKSGKNWFEWIWNSISCCAYQHRKTKEEMELMTFGLSPGHLYGLYQFSCGTGKGISIW